MLKALRQQRAKIEADRALARVRVFFWFSARLGKVGPRSGGVAFLRERLSAAS